MNKIDFQFVNTQDGSITIYNSEYNEAMHSVSGAYNESVLKHVYPSEILKKNKTKLNILDIGFGLGYNILALLYELYKNNSNTYLNIISFEKDKSYLPMIKSITFNDERDTFYKIIQTAFADEQYNSENLSIKIIFGDARISINSLNDIKFNAVFHDPFSPAKNPELWTVEFFQKIIGLMDENCILTTYSSAPQIRKAMIDAGLIIGKGPSVGKKREGTIASKNKIFRSLEKDELNMLLQNIKSTSYHDPDMKGARDSILNRRILEMKNIKIKLNHQAHQK